MHHIDNRRTQQRREIVVAENLRDAPLFRRGARALRGATDCGHLHAKPFEVFDVNGAAKAGANDPARRWVREGVAIEF